ncbi:restriction endonuclease subunit S [Alteromonas sediminis]|uniref:Restriction endonuclease subunit S n=1 Tax=Alteromonas sediminis TaxID=2259342 RepID=A0A3N5XXU6_9ALTE|nr:restriction endonuclease subunit S [Alteromonas sediminis]RPJ65303.1 restriction endonuclease subunit S [Alteromonas sediminis]
MEDNWKDCELGDVIELKRGYDLPKSKRKDGTVPIISSSGSSGCHNDFKISSPGVVTGRYGTIGEVFYVEENFWPLNTTLYVKDFKGNDPLFIYYLLQTISFQDYTDKGAVPGINRNHVHKAKVRVPESLEVQRDLGKKLYQFEQRMRLNQQINQTLEQMAQTLFKSWFVDFDPAVDNALAAGNPIPDELAHRVEVRKKAHALPDFHPLPEHIRNLFPSEFEQTGEPAVGIGGWVPKGWEFGRICNLCSRVESGGTPSRKEQRYWDNGNVPWLTSGEVRQTIVTKSNSFITEDGLLNSSAKLWQPFTTVVAMYGATAGQVTLLACETSANQACCALIPDTNSALYVFFKAKNSVQIYEGKASGSAQQNLNKTIVSNLEVILPPKELLKMFDNLLRPNVLKMMDNEQQNFNLEAIRDALLPKLISGEIHLNSTAENNINQEAELQGV